MTGSSSDGAVRSGRLRLLLGTLLAFGALNAFGGGYYGLRGAPGVPTEWLIGSPFRSYFVPSLILFVVVGGSLLVASVAVLWRRSHARLSSLVAGAVVMGWIVIQLAIIGYVSWMQQVTFAVALVILLLAWFHRVPGRSVS